MITRLTGIRRRAFGIGLSSYHDVAQLIRHHDHLAGRPSLEELFDLGILQHTALYLFTGEIPRQNELALDLAIELHHQLDLVPHQPGRIIDRPLLLKHRGGMPEPLPQLLPEMGGKAGKKPHEIVQDPLQEGFVHRSVLVGGQCRC